MSKQRKGKQWLSLSPNLVRALEELAEREGLTLSAFVSVLINEALAHRLREHRNG